jgi:hypothetical protein
MARFIIDAGAQIVCGHQSGRAKPALENPTARVWLSGEPAVTLPEPYQVIGCGAGTNACATARWLTGATRVRSMNRPLVLEDSKSMASSGAPLRPVRTQSRVKAT